MFHILAGDEPDNSRHISISQAQPEYLCVYFLNKAISSQVTSNNS